MSILRPLMAAMLVLPMTVDAPAAQLSPTSAQAMPASSADDSFKMFRDPELFRALYHGDTSALSANKTVNFIKLMIVVGALETPDAWFRMGQDAEAMLDPELGPTMRGLAMTDRELIGFVGGQGMKTLESVIGAWLGERKRQVRENTFDPFGELAEINTGLLRGASDMVRLKANAEMDAKRFMIVARDDSQSFMRMYETIREFVYSY